MGGDINYAGMSRGEGKQLLEVSGGLIAKGSQLAEKLNPRKAVEILNCLGITHLERALATQAGPAITPATMADEHRSLERRTTSPEPS